MNLPYTPSPVPVKACILLTMYIGDSSLQREEFYKKALRRWLSETSFDIYTIDSSGRKLDVEHERLRQESFEQEEGFVKLSPSQQEKKSLLVAHECYKTDFEKYDFVIKVTGKYFANTLDRILVYVPQEADLLLQNLTVSMGQNSEIVGIRTSKFLEVVKYISVGLAHFEQTLSMISTFSAYKVYRLPPIYIAEGDRLPRGDGSTLMSL